MFVTTRKAPVQVQPDVAIVAARAIEEEEELQNLQTDNQPHPVSKTTVVFRQEK